LLFLVKGPSLRREGLGGSSFFVYDFSEEFIE